jgi:hypothetical protein
MSKLDQLRAQREAWASGKPSPKPNFETRAAIAELTKPRPVTFIPSIKSNIKSNRMTSVASEVSRVVQLEATSAPGTKSKRGRPAKPDGATKDRAAYMRARRKKP